MSDDTGTQQAPGMSTPEFEALPASVQKVQRALHEAGVDARVVMLADAARTSQQAADALGVELGQIAKSLVFRTRDSQRAVLVIASGSHRVDERKVAALLGEKIERAAPDFVRERTGYAIGGIPPVGHATALEVLLDRTLARYAVVWGAAGHPHSVFPIAPARLFEIAGGRVEDVAHA
jgi:prolyl-tRNA editing enzyme YbaK/EbsC (Cys-tRNA(Pro) deacylase)